MIRNYLLVTLRNLARHRAYSIINIVGLAVGLATSIFIFLWPGFDSRRIKNNRQTPMNPIATASRVDGVVLLQS